MPSTKPGRRPGTPATREGILAAARESFGAAGFERATIRDIAARAAVDPALVIHYFGSKDALFATAMQLPVEPAAFAARIFADGPECAGTRLAEAFLALWEDPRFAAQVRGILRAAVSHEAAAASLRTFIEGQVVEAVTGHLGEQARLHIELAGSHLVGLAFARYILRAEPLASASLPALIDLVAPVLQGYLSGAVPGSAL